MSKKLVTLTTLKHYLNLSKRKKSGEAFTNSDVQSYIRRGHLPRYLGGNSIEPSEEVEGVKLYFINSDTKHAESIL